MGPNREGEGVCERPLFVLDPNGVIFWSYCSPIAVDPGADGILDALERLPNKDGSMLKVPVTQRDHILGSAKAPVTLVEYGDYECPHCGAAHPIVKLVLEHFGDSVRFVFRHFPLTEVHPNAEPAAESAEFCGAHGRFWEMHDGIYDNQDRLGLPLLFELTSALGLSEADLRQALVNRTYAERVRSDFLGGVRSGVNGTPSFFINGRRHEGSYAFGDLVSAVAANLHHKVLI